MDTLTTFAIGMLAVCAIALAASAAALVATELVPRIVRRARVRRLAIEVQRLADEHAARPAPRQRHAAHCPACGRFARVTSSGPRGTWTRCSSHGVRLRATRRIGRLERTLVEVTAYRPLFPALPLLDIPPLVTSPLAIAAPVRMPDWLDAVPTTTLERALAA